MRWFLLIHSEKIKLSPSFTPEVLFAVNSVILRKNIKCMMIVAALKLKHRLLLVYYGIKRLRSIFAQPYPM